MLLTFLAVLAAPATGPCGPPAMRLACLRADAAAAVTDFSAVAMALPGAIDSINDAGMERSAEDVAAWKAQAAKVVSLWAAFRDARCDPALLRFEGQAGPVQWSACRARISRAAAADLGVRYDLRSRKFGRRDVETEAAAPQPSGEDSGPCAHVPPAECDYCGLNHCWEARLKADDAQLRRLAPGAGENCGRAGARHRRARPVGGAAAGGAAGLAKLARRELRTGAAGDAEPLGPFHLCAGDRPLPRRGDGGANGGAGTQLPLGYMFWRAPFRVATSASL